jgi:hypothetical protein
MIIVLRADKDKFMIPEIISPGIPHGNPFYPVTVGEICYIKTLFPSFLNWIPGIHLCSTNRFSS